MRCVRRAEVAWLTPWASQTSNLIQNHWSPTLFTLDTLDTDTQTQAPASLLSIKAHIRNSRNNTAASGHLEQAGELSQAAAWGCTSLPAAQRLPQQWLRTIHNPRRPLSRRLREPLSVPALGPCADVDEASPDAWARSFSWDED